MLQSPQSLSGTLAAFVIAAGIAAFAASAAAAPRSTCAQKGVTDGWRYYADQSMYFITRSEFRGWFNIQGGYDLLLIEDPDSEIKKVVVTVDGKEIVSDDDLLPTGGDDGYVMLILGKDEHLERFAAEFARGRQAVIRIEYTRSNTEGVESFKINLESMRKAMGFARRTHIARANLMRAKKCTPGK